MRELRKSQKFLFDVAKQTTSTSNIIFYDQLYAPTYLQRYLIRLIRFTKIHMHLIIQTPPKSINRFLEVPYSLPHSLVIL